MKTKKLFVLLGWILPVSLSLGQPTTTISRSSASIPYGSTVNITADSNANGGSNLRAQAIDYSLDGSNWVSGSGTSRWDGDAPTNNIVAPFQITDHVGQVQFRARAQNMDFALSDFVYTSVAITPSTTISFSTPTPELGATFTVTSVTNAAGYNITAQAIDYSTDGGSTWTSGSIGEDSRWEGSSPSNTLVSSFSFSGKPKTIQFRARGIDANGVLSEFATGQVKTHGLFKILVNTNTITPTEAASASSFVADGVWWKLDGGGGLTSTERNSLMSTLDTGWVISEDTTAARWGNYEPPYGNDPYAEEGNPNPGPYPTDQDPNPTNPRKWRFFTGYETDNKTSATTHRGSAINAAMVYHEPLGRFWAPYDCVLSTAQITDAASSYGVGIVVDARRYDDTAPSWYPVGGGTKENYLFKTHVDAALLNSNCSGVSFENQAPVDTNISLVAGINATLSAGKKCYLLIPAKSGYNYTDSVVASLDYISSEPNGENILADPNFMVVVSIYDTPNEHDFLTKSSPDGNSVQEAVAALKAYRSP